MTYASGVVAVGTAPTAICSPGPGGLVLQNLGAAVVSLGGPNVVAGAGFTLLTGTAPVPLPWGLRQYSADLNDTLYGAVASGTVNVGWIMAQ
jgi:hypothetical protein